MNRLNINQTGGFGLKTERLTEMQTAYEIFNAFGHLAGNLTIISGCVLAGTVVSDGFVFINGEILPFKSAYVSANVVIIENITAKEFENGENKNVHYERFATFGTAEISWPWDDFVRPMQTKDVAGALADKVPLSAFDLLIERIQELEAKTSIFQSGGGMFFWNKPANQIPAGFAEVVNWRGRIPVGFDSTQTEFNAIGKVGGTKTKIITNANLPSVVSTNAIRLAETQTAFGIKTGTNTWVNPATITGGNQPLDVLNPYRVVMFIQWVGL